MLANMLLLGPRLDWLFFYTLESFILVVRFCLHWPTGHENVHFHPLGRIRMHVRLWLMTTQPATFPLGGRQTVKVD